MQLQLNENNRWESAKFHAEIGWTSNYYPMITSYLTIFLFTLVGSCQDAPKSIRKWWKSRRKTNDANLRNRQSSFQLWANGRGSQYFSVCFFHTYMKEDIQYCLELFSKNIFSDAHPFYQSHLSMIGLYRNYWAKKLQLTVAEGRKRNWTKILTQFLLSYHVQCI